MDKVAYELGIKCALVDCGLLKEAGIKVPLASLLAGASIGGLTGAAVAPKGKGLKGALLGAGLGAGGFVGGAKLIKKPFQAKAHAAGQEALKALRLAGKTLGLVGEALTIAGAGVGGGALLGGAVGGTLV